MRTVVFAELRFHGRRAIAAAAAVMIGVAFVVAVLGAVQTMNGYIKQAVATRATLSDVVVLPGDDGELPAGLARAVAAVPGVQAADAVREGYTRVRWSDGEDYSLVASVPASEQLRWMSATGGRLPTAPDEVAVDDSTAAKLGLTPGSELTIGRTEGGPLRLRVVGVADLGDSPMFGGQRTLLGTEAAVGSWTGSPVTEIDVAGGGDGLRDAVAAAAGPGAEVRTGEEHAAEVAKMYTGGSNVLGGLLLGFAAVALGVAGIVIANTFGIVVAQRTRQLALLRSVGATRRQVFRAVLAESAVVGTVAALSGVLLGAGLVAGGARVASALADVRVDAALPLWALIIPFLAGLVVALVSALFPAARATRIAPLAALRPASPSRGRRTSRIRVGTAIVFALLGTALLVIGSTPAGLIAGIPGGALVTAALLLAGPVLFPAAVRLLGLALRPFGPVGRIAVANSVRDPHRTSATGVALLVGVMLVSLVSVGAASSKATLNERLGELYPVDVALLAPAGEPLTERAADAAGSTAGVTGRLDLRGGSFEVGGSPVDVAAAAAQLDTVSRTPIGVRRGEIVVPEDRASDVGVGDGQRVTVTGPDGEATLTARLVRVPTAFVAPDVMASLDAKPELLGVWLRTADDVDVDRLRTDLRTAAPDSTTMGAILDRQAMDQLLTVLLRIVTALLAIAVLIAVIGIGNTLSLSVLERGRESGLQRALGMTRRQLRASLGVEALLLAGAASVLGVVVGGLLGVAGAAALLGPLTGTVVVAVPWGWIAGVVAGAVTAGLLASVLPARRAAQVPPSVALAQD